MFLLKLLKEVIIFIGAFVVAALVVIIFGKGVDHEGVEEKK